MSKTAFRIAASAAVVAATMVACTAQSEAMRRNGVAKASRPADRDAHELHEQARRALHQGQVAEAQAAMENAVELAPRDAGYRLLLADIYMKVGRFESARTTYADVLEIDSTNVRAGLGYALMQIALGRPQAAVAQLDELEGRAAAADLGLAYALAGLPERGIEILEPEARSLVASPRVRQNLALSYALAGDWQRARVVAAQDVSPAELGPRLQQWATFARPDVSTNRVASLLGVVPAADPGQPIRLALATPQPAPATAELQATAATVQLTEAPAPAIESAPAPVPVQLAEAPTTEPVETAEAPSYYLPPEATAQPDELSEEEADHAVAARTLTRPEPAVVRVAAVSLPPAPVFRREDPVTASIRRGDSRFVVQLGAFAVEGNAERAWVQAEQRFGLQDYQPLTTTFRFGDLILHRVSVAGFDSRSEAQRLCRSIQSSGGACFVRASAGDAAVRWAARYGPERRDRDA